MCNRKKDFGRIKIEKTREMALKKLVGEEVTVKATVSVRSLDRYNRKIETMCLASVWINNKPLHHLWIRSDRNSLVTCNQIQGNDMIQFTGVVYEYTRNDGTVNYSVSLKKGCKVQLVKAQYE